MKLLKATSLLLALGVTCAAQAEANLSDSHMGLRYRFISADAGLTRWEGPVGIQAIGLQEPETQMMFLGKYLSLARAAKTELDVFGFPNEVFEPQGSVDSGTRILVIEADFPEPSDGQMTLAEADTGIDLSRAYGGINTLSKTPMEKAFSGCYITAWVDTDNTFQSVIHLINANEPISRKLRCLEALPSYGFGISTTVTILHPPKGYPADGEYPDETDVFYAETYFTLQIASYCSEIVGDNRIQCALEASNGLMDHYGELANKAKNVRVD